MAKINVCKRHGALVALNRLKLTGMFSGYLRLNQIRIIDGTCQLCNNEITIELPVSSGEADLLPIVLLIFNRDYSNNNMEEYTVENNMEDAVFLAKEIAETFSDKEALASDPTLLTIFDHKIFAATHSGELAIRALARPEWRWMAGMLARTISQKTPGLSSYHRIVETAADGPHIVDLAGKWSLLPDNSFPIVLDPATLGCLLKIVEEKHTTAYNMPVEAIYLSPGINTDGKSVYWEASLMYYRGLTTEFKYGRSKAEALVIALESDVITD